MEKPSNMGMAHVIRMRIIDVCQRAQINLENIIVIPVGVGAQDAMIAMAEGINDFLSLGFWLGLSLPGWGGGGVGGCHGARRLYDLRLGLLRQTLCLRLCSGANTFSGDPFLFSAGLCRALCLGLV